MSKVNSLLTQRLKPASEKLSKMTNLAELSSSGNLSSFSGVFKVAPLSSEEESHLKLLLESHKEEGTNVIKDLSELSALTSEVKAICNQAIILHGERIKKAQGLLKSYKEGAFTSWLIHTYGNRQTPYNFLQYYEFYHMLPQGLLSKLDEMPRQAAYTLASRQGDFQKKEEIVRNYQGETKQSLLDQIRKIFPLKNQDKRAQDDVSNLIKSLVKLTQFVSLNQISLSQADKKKVSELFIGIKNILNL